MQEWHLVILLSKQEKYLEHNRIIITLNNHTIQSSVHLSQGQFYCCCCCCLVTVHHFSPTHLKCGHPKASSIEILIESKPQWLGSSKIITIILMADVSNIKLFISFFFVCNLKIPNWCLRLLRGDSNSCLVVCNGKECFDFYFELWHTWNNYFTFRNITFYSFLLSDHHLNSQRLFLLTVSNSSTILEK